MLRTHTALVVSMQCALPSTHRTPHRTHTYTHTHTQDPHTHRIPDVIDVVVDEDGSDIQDNNRLNTGQLY